MQKAMPMPLIETSRATLHYRDYRLPDVDRPPVLLIHGAGGNFRNWPVPMRRLAHAVALDLPGHGGSPLPGRTTIAEYAADCAACLEALGITRAIIAGHSMGGAIAQQLALAYPSLVQGLVLVGTGARLPVNEAIITGIAQHPEVTAANLMDWSWAQDTPHDIKQQGAQMLLDVPVAVLQGDYRACAGFDVVAQLAQIAVPTLVMGGTADKMTRFAWSQTLAERIPNATLVAIDGGGHMMLLEQPDHTTTLLLNWLDNR